MEHAELIDSAEALEALCAHLQQQRWFALDTEFVREKTYYPKLCLIQVATAQQMACIDPLHISDLSPFLACLHNPAITKVLHAASQDLELFYCLDGRVPAPIFDTQLAGALLGYGDQAGYAKLVSAMLGVELDKDMTRTDWSQRPLSAAQLRYAEDDVRYLAQLYPLMHTQLSETRRLEWLASDFAALSEARHYESQPAKAWKRIKGHQTLRGPQLAVLASLASWRESEAMRANRPRRWIIADDPLLDMARQQPNTAEKLARIRGVNEGSLRRYEGALLNAIAQGKQLPQEQWPQLSLRTRLEPPQEALVEVAMGLLKHQAHLHQISPLAIGGRHELELMVQGETETALDQGWRARLVGSVIRQWLAGELSLQVSQDALILQPLAQQTIQKA